MVYGVGRKSGAEESGWGEAIMMVVASLVVAVVVAVVIDVVRGDGNI